MTKRILHNRLEIPEKVAQPCDRNFFRSNPTRQIQARKPTSSDNAWLPAVKSEFHKLRETCGKSFGPAVFVLRSPSGVIQISRIVMLPTCIDVHSLNEDHLWEIYHDQQYVALASVGGGYE